MMGVKRRDVMGVYLLKSQVMGPRLSRNDSSEKVGMNRRILAKWNQMDQATWGGERGNRMLPGSKMPWQGSTKMGGVKRQMNRPTLRDRKTGSPSAKTFHFGNIGPKIGSGANRLMRDSVRKKRVSSGRGRLAVKPPACTNRSSRTYVIGKN